MTQPYDYNIILEAGMDYESNEEYSLTNRDEDMEMTDYFISLTDMEFT